MSFPDGEPAMAGARDGRARPRGGPMTREQVRELQRARLMEAMVSVVEECGLRGATVSLVVARAGVSRVTFYELFGGLEGCFLAVLDGAMRRSVALISDAVAEHEPWDEKVVAGLAALLCVLDADPPLARICLVEALAAGPAALEYRVRELELLKHLLAAIWALAPEDRQVASLWPEAVVASVAGVLHTRIVTGEAPPFLDLLEPLASLIIAPGPGEREALDGLVIRLGATYGAGAPASAWRREDVSVPSALLAPGAYRARLCLLYLVDHPGVSNRTVAQGIGIAHLGQAAALLGRLERLALLAKRAGGPGKPNAWRLTPEGERIAAALGART